MEGIQLSIGRLGALGDIALVKVAGYVDTMTSSELWKSLGNIFKDGIYNLVVDLGGVQYVSSAGWGVFVGEIRGIRERGGDLKIVHMSPEVYDVFEMLEFNHILQCYECIEEAINEFDILRGIDLRQSTWKGPRPVTQSAEPEIEAPPVPVASRPLARGARRASPAASIDEARLPLHEKIKRIIIGDPTLGLWGIYKSLRSPRFGTTTVNLWKLHSVLKALNLETKEKRYRFYRSR